jgi:DNA repair exonuclease SbcCD nuclease subunit
MSGIILCADPHFGLTTHDGPALDGSPSWRQNEARQVAQFISDTTTDLESVLIVAGDLFTSVRPQAWAYNAAELLKADRIIPGNHDLAVGEGVMSPLATKAFRNAVEWKPAVESFDGIDLALIPWFSRAFVASAYPDLLVGEQNRYMAGALERIVADLCSQKRAGVPLVAVTHFTIGGATYNSDVQPQLGESSDFMVPRSVFDRPELAAVFSGHIHRPQVLHGDYNDVTYIGSPVRSDSGERDQPTRILHITNEDGQIAVEEILTPSVRFVDIPLDGMSEPIPGAVCRIVGEAAAGEQTASAIAALTDELYKFGALHVSKPAVKFTRHEARTVRLIEVDAKPSDALRSYSEMVGGEYEANLPELLRLQTEIEGKVLA